MPVSECAACARLVSRYGAATAARIRAEADLTAAAFSHDLKAVAMARRAAQAAVAAWKEANAARREHEKLHTKGAGASAS